MAGELFKEEQWFPNAVGAVIGAMLAGAALTLALGGRRGRAWAGTLLSSSGGLLAVTAAFAPMRTTVTPEGVQVSFGLPGWIRFRVDAAGIRGVEAVTYRPLAEFGGWGIRLSLGGTRAYTARGNQGVRVRTTRGEYLIGSQRPEELAAALRQIAPSAQEE
ncbi:MAG: hypothetical protein GX774_09210 [Armatimonadetes bacterium]|jgi:hypothetical protein|nr:hypothetical protein [Armatimonadota bacterium]